MCFPACWCANAKAFEDLVDRSIRYRPPSGDALRPFVVGQVTDFSATGLRSLQKVGIMRALFGQYGHSMPSLVTRTSQVRRADGKSGSQPSQWEVMADAPGRFIKALPPPAKQALDEASLLVMFGHGVPGMTCSLDVEAFHDVAHDRQSGFVWIVHVGGPAGVRFPPCGTGPDGSAVQNDRERFAMRAVANGAVVVDDTAAQRRIPPSLSRIGVLDERPYGGRGLPASDQRRHRDEWSVVARIGAARRRAGEPGCRLRAETLCST